MAAEWIDLSGFALDADEEEGGLTTEVDRRRLLRAVPYGLAICAGVGTALFAGGGAAHAKLKATGTISIPKIGLKKTIYAGIANDALAAGIGHGLWSAKLGSGGHVQLFGHRTSRGGPFRNLHKLKAGDSITAGGITYRVRRVDVLSVSEKEKIWAYEGGGARISLVACSKANGLPTSTSYRICVRASA